MRHVLEHNVDWRRILANAVASFRKRMVLIIFTPMSDETRTIATSNTVTSFPVPDISFRKEDLTDYFSHLKYTEASFATDTVYGIEHLFYIEKQPLITGSAMPEPVEFDEPLLRELDAWSNAGLTARFWWRDDDAVTDTLQLRCLLDIARNARIVPAIAVVPEHADDSLVTLLSSTECCVWQHGWGHYTYTAGEFGEARATDLMADDVGSWASTPSIPCSVRRGGSVCSFLLSICFRCVSRNSFPASAISASPRARS